MGTVSEELALDPAVYRALTEHATDLVTILDADGTVRYASPSCQRLLGYAPAELQGTSAFEHVHPEDVRRMRAAFGAAMQADDGTPVRVQCRCRHANGSWRVMATTGSSHLADPVIHGFIATSYDVTERVEAEEHLHEKEAQYRSIFEATTEGLSIVDMDGFFVEVNPAFCAMFGYRHDELIGLHATAVMHPDEYHLLAEAFPIIAAGGSVQVGGRGLRKDGTPFHTEANGTLFTYKGKPHALGVVRDISGQVQIQAQLREKEEQYRGIFEATSDGVAIIDFDGRVIEVNPALCAMFGYRHDELIGLHADALTHPDYRHLLPESLSILATGGSVQVQAMSMRKDGTPFHAESNATIFTYKGQPHILGVVRDITERVRAQELLEQRVAERTHELSTLLEVSHNVASTLELQPLLGLILDQLNMVVEYTGAGIAVQDGMMVRIIAYRGPDCDERPLGPIPVAQAGSLWQWMRQSEPVSIPDVRADTAAARIYRETVGDAVYTSLSHVRSWMAVPMRVKDRDIGSLFLEHSTPDAYTEHHMSVALAIAQQAAIAMENARLYEQAQAVAVLEERQRLARELHDSVSQALYGIGLGVHTAQLLLARDPARVLETLDYVRDLAQAGLAEMRALIFELLPEALESEGLVAALEKQIAAVRARHGIAIKAMLGTEPDTPLVLKEAIYRIAQEALHNTVKHAQARTVELRLEARAEELLLEVRDDGAGFDPRGRFPGHLGLRTMRERATRLGGTLELESVPGQGTCIRAAVPCRLA